ncbi:MULTISPECIES: TetR family transcriptional regulator [unclassified Streptomyces]|uniref:TetR family transcriptional regulator n=1 Tax=unclassified Streptomyces TaxID=2593676 RepID=UPI0036E3977D
MREGEGKLSVLRGQKRLAVQKLISDAALPLFLERGFAEVTTDQISAAAGISPRSFFRYFETKEDVVVGYLTEAGRHVQAALEDRPPAEASWDALRAAFGALLMGFSDSRQVLRRTTRMLLETPSLRARHLEKQLQWQEFLVPDIAKRLGSTAGIEDVRASALVASALACLDAAANAWAVADDDTPIETLLDAAISAVRHGS